MSGNTDQSLTGFQEFCGGDVWDVNLTWLGPNITWPQFTPCFQETVLQWIPCGWLWCTLPITLIWMFSQRGTPLKPSKLRITKTLVGFILILLNIVEIILAATGHIYDDPNRSVPLSWYITPGIKLLTFVVSIILIQMERRLGFITSGFQFIFYLLTILTGVIPFYSNIYYLQGRGLGAEESDAPIIVFYVEFVFVVILWLLHFPAETLPTEEYGVTIKSPCPEILSSFISRITYWWINTLVLTGYKKSLEESDIWDLNPRDKCAKIVPEFDVEWRKEVMRTKQINDANMTPEERRREHYQANFLLQNSTEKTPLLGNSNGKVNSYSSNTEIKTVAHSPDEPVEVKKKEASLFKVMGKLYGSTLFQAFMCKFVYDLLQFVNPMILNLLIAFTEDKSMPTWKGYIYMLGMFLTSIFSSAMFHQNFFIGMSLGMRIKAAVIAAVYKKALTMNNEARKTSTVGEIVNLMSVDAQRLQDLTGYLWMLWSAPVQISLAMTLLYFQMGPAVFAGLGVMVILLPINAIIAIKTRAYQVEQMKQKDNRIKLMNEVLNGIKVLKLYAWELSFQEKIAAIRQKELDVLKKAAYLGAFSTFAWTCAPFMVTLASFVAYILSDPENHLDATTAFVSLTLFNILRFPINLLPMMISYVVMAQVSIGRIGKFLRCGDLDLESVDHNQSSSYPITIDNGTFAWDRTERICLKNINLSIPDGGLVAVVGQVGSGKSSLISSLLGEMDKLMGKVNVRGRIAYVPQQAWIQNATVKDNILFGKDMDDKEYTGVLNACALQPDLAVLAGGDMTEIGEKGINLSGGQKQRVSLARAVYNDADIYLLDDPLSAVDSHVGKHIFDNVIGRKGILSQKTRILVTHGIHWLPMVDQIVVMTDGEISEVGTYDELMSHHGSFARFIQTYLTQDIDEATLESEDQDVQETKLRILERLDSVLSQSDDHTASADDDTKAKISRSMRTRKKSLATKQSTVEVIKSIEVSVELSKSLKKQEKEKATEKLIMEETSQTGQVKYAVYFSYGRAIGIISSICIILFFTLYQAANVGSNIWLSTWTEDPLLKNLTLTNTSEYKNKNYMYLGVYGAFGIGQAFFVLFYSLIFAVGQIRASKWLHSGMLANILRSPMAFFDTTPIGRIVNRFSRDIETVDNNLPQLIRQFFNTFFSVLSTLVAISYSTPIFLSVVLPLGILYYLVQRLYIPTARQLKRVESTTRSPIYNHFSESVTGASTIRAYGVQDRFQQESEGRVDRNLVFYFAGVAANRWLGVRLEFVGNCLVMAASLFAVVGRETLSGGLVGLSVSYALQVTSALNFMVRATTDMETNVVSVERIKEYTETPTEPEWYVPEKKPPANWPDKGELVFRDYMTRYRPGLGLVLRGISCDMKGGEKIGIVGRTGAGKSSLTVALFRLIEATRGSIVIDDVVIADIGLHDLRAKLTILPQDPVLFSGTLRMNLDPFDQYTDEQVWRALEHAHLKNFVQSLPTVLMHECGEGGQNLSVGQRQLVCLARTLLRKTKILILDEATAAVDMETDDLIQKTIRTEFSECTVITIAHRLNTILDYDRILVLDNGEITEYDTPDILLKNKKGAFYLMAKDAGLV